MCEPPLVAVVGATATGKSDLAIALAEELNGEVVNADALQLYRGLDIGTAKVPASERRGVPHHLLDVLEVSDEASVAAYQRDARRAVREIRARGHRPIVVGGSGLYVRALLDQIAFPPREESVRRRYEDDARRIGPEALHARLQERDPAAAAVIGVRDQRRIVRALEVGELTGGSFRAFLPEARYEESTTIQVGLRMRRDELHHRIEQRVAGMVRQGLLEETRHLCAAGLAQGRTASRAIGYQQALAVLDGTMSCADAIADTISATGRLVRKQDTWFRRDSRITWCDASAPDLRSRALAVIRGGEQASAAPPH